MKLTKSKLKQLIKELYGADDKSTDPKYELSGRHKPHYTSHGADYERFEPEYKMTKLHPDHPEYTSPEREMQANFRYGCNRRRNEEGWTEEQFERCLELTSEYHAKRMDNSFKGNLWQKVEHIIDQEAGLDPYEERGRRSDISYEKESTKRQRERDRERRKPKDPWRMVENKNITKAQFKRIIKEELEDLQKEGFMDWVKDPWGDKKRLRDMHAKIDTAGELRRKEQGAERAADDRLKAARIASVEEKQDALRQMEQLIDRADAGIGDTERFHEDNVFPHLEAAMDLYRKHIHGTDYDDGVLRDKIEVLWKDGKKMIGKAAQYWKDDKAYQDRMRDRRYEDPHDLDDRGYEPEFKVQYRENKLTKSRLKQTIKEEFKTLTAESKYKVGDKVVHDSDDLGKGKVVAVEPGKKGNIVVKWESGTKTHHRWALRPSKKEKTDEINKA